MSDKQKLADEDVVMDITGKVSIEGAIQRSVNDRSFSFNSSAELKQRKFPEGWASK